MPTPKPLWLVLAPVIFLLLWSGGFSVAKLGIQHAEPLSFLALRYASVLVLLAPLLVIMRPPLPQKPAEWMHLAIVGFLIQTIYFGLSYMAFKAGVSAGGQRFPAGRPPARPARERPASAQGPGRRRLLL